MTKTVIAGGCLCGAVRYQSSSKPIRGVICHCSMCRKHSGAPALSFFHFPTDSFIWMQGQPTRYRSSKYAERGFCSKCGSILTMHEEVLTDRVQVTAGSLDHPDQFHPDDHVWVEDQIAWMKICDDLAKFNQSSPAAASKAQEE